MKKNKKLIMALLCVFVSVNFAACSDDDNDDTPGGNTEKPVSKPVIGGKVGNAVDLGLSVKWSDCNLGANKAEEAGCYFAWGETTTKTEYLTDNSSWYEMSYSTLLSQGVINSNGNLTSAFDAASVNWKGKWRMPTYAELRELKTQCNWKFTTQNGVKGFIVSSKTTKNSIFLPAAGCKETDNHYVDRYGLYWSATVVKGKYSEEVSHAYCLWAKSGNSEDDLEEDEDGTIRTGVTIRPVQ